MKKGGTLNQKFNTNNNQKLIIIRKVIWLQVENKIMILN